MKSFDVIYQEALLRKGGIDELEKLLPPPCDDEELRKISDDRWLSAMTKGIFRAGFVWKIIDHKWPDFETVFDGFQVQRCAMSSPDDFERRMKDARIVRNGQKIKTVMLNAQFILDIAKASKLW